MRLELHPQISSDISRIMEYYEDVAGQQLADEFYAELRSFFQKAADAPEAFSIRERDLRRVNLERFPSSASASAYWLCDTTRDTRRWDSIDGRLQIFRAAGSSRRTHRAIS